MDANGFISKLKADGSEKDFNDFEKVFEKYKTVYLNLSIKDKGSFALNVLCVLCRNLDKVPQWRERIDNKSLLTLGIECVRGTRSMPKEDKVKTLACIYHIHRHVVKQTSLIAPELVLKFSYMPFEGDDTSLLTDYHKTYWSIVAERLTYVEKLKCNKIAVTKLLPKIIDDVLRVIKMYDSMQFTGNFLVFLVKKLNFIFTDCSEELNVSFQKIFDALAKSSMDGFKNLNGRDAINIYEKLNEGFVVVIENGLKSNFKGLHLDDIVRCCANMFGQRPDIFHCLQTFYLNAFCCIFNEKAAYNSVYIDTILKNMAVSCETAEKLGYKTAMYATYPFLNQYLRIYIEQVLTETHLLQSESTLIYSLKFTLLLMKKLSKATQLLKCENCPVKSGLHDALRLSFVAKNLISASITNGVDLKNILPYYYSIVGQQYAILYELRSLGCSNFNKCFRKLQTDVHNTAITLNKAQYYEFSIKIFDVYLINEVRDFKMDSESRNLTRGLYNKSICQLDCKLYNQALNDAFLSLVLANSEPGTDKYMSLVMDIKAKMLKNVSEPAGDDNSLIEENQDNFQMLTVLDVTRMLLESNSYGNLKALVKNVKFGVLLKHEFSMYVKLWPSIVPIAGVWRSLRDMVNGRHDDWLPVVENREDILKILYEVVLETPTAVRTIHSDYYKEIIMELVENLEEKSIRSTEEQVVLGTLLLLKSEYDMTDASHRYAWKTSEHTIDPDCGEAIRTLPQEHHASKSAVRAVEIWTQAIKNVTKTSPLLHHALKIAEVFVQQFLYMHDTVHGLQLASICSELALVVADKECYIRNVGIIISHAERDNKFVKTLIHTASKYVPELMINAQTLDSCLTYICELAIFYNKQEIFSVTARLVGFVQTMILEAFETQPNINLDVSMGRLMEAHCELVGGKHREQTILSSVNNIQRHYIAIASSGAAFTSRRARAILLKRRSSASGLRATHAAFSLRLFRRARAAAAATLPRASAVAQAFVYGYITNVGNVEDTQIKIDNRLKHILGLQPTNETQPYCLTTQTVKHEMFTPKTCNIETMLDSMTFKKVQTSPSLPSIPAFKMPEFFNHEQLCTCYACQTVSCDVIACFACGLEASMYFQAKEFNIARNYFEGALKMFELAEGRFKNKMAVFKSRGFNENILDIVACGHRKEFREILIQFLIDASLFEIAQKFYDKSDDHVVRIHEILSEMRTINPYIENEVYNLMVMSASVRRVMKTPECGLETDFESLKLDPVKDNEILKTPESKYLPVNATPKIVKGEEVPNVKLKVIKLNLDDNSDEIENENVNIKPQRNKKEQFKVPVPVTVRPALESITPRPSRSKPALTLTQPSLDVENTPNGNEFFTPKSTPNKELFFTPMTSVKTYGKKSNIVKNLEAEFSTPKSVKKTTEAKIELESKVKVTKSKDDCKSRRGQAMQNIEVKEEMITKKVENKSETKKKVETGSMKSLREKRSLKRATSPGKLVDEDKPGTRSRRRQPLDVK